METEVRETESSSPMEPATKKPKLDNDVDNHAKAMKVAGFSLSAITEMRINAEGDGTNRSLDKQLRQFQVLDEVGSNSEDEDGKCTFKRGVS